jgi:hypothetical protein
MNPVNEIKLTYLISTLNRLFDWEWYHSKPSDNHKVRRGGSFPGGKYPQQTNDFIINDERRLYIRNKQRDTKIEFDTTYNEVRTIGSSVSRWNYIDIADDEQVVKVLTHLIYHYG